MSETANTGTYNIEDVKLAAFLVASTGNFPRLDREYQAVKVTFRFPNTPPVLAAVEAFESGAAVPAKLLLEIHGQLMHRAGKLMRKHQVAP